MLNLQCQHKSTGNLALQSVFYFLIELKLSLEIYVGHMQQQKQDVIIKCLEI